MLSAEFPIDRICKIMSVNRSSFYKWHARLLTPSDRIKRRNEDILLFKEYHDEYPTHGYRWLNAKIRLDLGVVYSDNYAHRCCKYAEIKSKSRRFKYRRPGERNYIYPNLLINDLNVDGPMQVIVSDMTAFWCQNTYYELTLYMDLFNNEILCYGISTKRGDRETYFDGLEDLIEKKKEYQNLKTILHTDQGSVYSSKSYNELLPLHNITHSMSKAGTPTDNSSMEAINGWLKEELFNDFHLSTEEDVERCIKEYIHFFNNERPAYCLDYLTPEQFKRVNCPLLVD